MSRLEELALDLQTWRIAFVVLFALGTWLMLPRGGAQGRWLGATLLVVGLAALGWTLPELGMPLFQGIFVVMASVTVLSALCTISFRSPTYCAIWFGLTLLGTCGLLLMQGAQFLALATLTVYAGAILVTFLFVLMLAQPGGHASYDRMSWEAFFSAGAGALVVGLLTWAFSQSILLPPEELVARAQQPDAPAENAEAAPEDEEPMPESGLVTARTAEQLEGKILTEHHMASLGGELFSQHLIAVEIAGVLLLVALVGAAAMVVQEKHAQKAGSA